MLLHLYIRDFALIKSVDLEFSKGLNIITGETGAGKSILIEAINAVLGSKSTSNLIRTEAEYAYIELIFQIEKEKQEYLTALDIDLEADNTLILSKKIMHGRSLCKINDRTVTVKKIRQITNLMIDIHSQHEHQSLLYRQKYLDILDAFAQENIKILKAELKQNYLKYKELYKYLDAFMLDEETRLREIDFCEFEIQEIESANLIPDEEEKLRQEYKKLSNSKKITEVLMELSQLLGSESTNTVGEMMNYSIQKIQDIRTYDTKLEEIALQLNSIDDILKSTNREIIDYLNSIHCDEKEFQDIESRLNLIRNLQMKYGKDFEAIMDNLNQRKQRLEELQNYEQNKKDAETSIKVYEDQIINLCTRLSEIRKKIAEKIGFEIKKSLEELNFLNVKFEINISKTNQFTDNGFDEVQFMISTNPGEPLKPLSDIASGGELSRIMLAIKTVLADIDDIPTLIFDEIDTGISGRTAQQVSEKLSCVSKSHQILCITHLPQIAAMADRHFLINKEVIENRTQTQVTHLSMEESVEELARLIGGAKITDKVLQSAKEMKELAKKI